MVAKSFPEAILGRPILRSGFQYSRNDAIERTPMDSELSRGRLFNSNPLARVPCTFDWAEDEVAFFEAWLQTVANRGASWFTIYLPLEGATYRQVLARVASVPPRTAPVPGRMRVPIEFEVHDSLIVPEGLVELILEVGTTGAQEMAAALEDTSLMPFFIAWEFPG